MTPSFSPLDSRAPPPAYSEALSYPEDHHYSIPAAVERKNQINNLHKNTSSSTPSQHNLSFIPDDVVYLCKSSQTYYNVETYQKLKYIYSYRKNTEGQSVIVLEALPETLASSKDCMGVKTYAKIEVVEAEREKSTSMCVAGCSTSVDRLRDPEMLEPSQPNGKTVHMPMNGLIYNDRMIVESLLTDVRSLSPDLSEKSDKDEDEHLVAEKLVEEDLEHLTHALENEDNVSLSNDERCVHFEEYTPFLSGTESRCSNFKKPNDLLEHKVQVRQDSELDYADSGYSDTHKADLREHLSDQHAQHNVLDNVIYSEPHRSSSDLSIKCAGESANHSIDKHQRTLTRTNNAADHTVYDLCPSDSFYNSADSMHMDAKRNSFSSNDQLSKVGPKFSSLTDVNRSRTRLSGDTSVSFHKPNVATTDTDCSTCKTTQQEETEVRMADSEPLVSLNTKQASSTEALSSQLMLEDTRTYYRRKAADRGTMYCAGSGIIVVATIVFLLIYFS